MLRLLRTIAVMCVTLAVAFVYGLILGLSIIAACLELSVELFKRLITSLDPILVTVVSIIYVFSIAYLFVSNFVIPAVLILITAFVFIVAAGAILKSSLSE